MFDVGFSEIALIAVVALLVLGPERLPKAARTAGALLRRARASWQNVRGEIERELAAEDLRKSMREVRRAADIRPDVEAAAREAASVAAAAPDRAPTGQDGDERP
jgi:sec-independent protein translocase protein TatB